MKVTIAWLLPLLIFPIPIFGQSSPHDNPDEARARFLAQWDVIVKANKVFSVAKNPGGDPKHISHEFREVAGDTFDEVTSLETAELKGPMFFEPILHEAELAVTKAERKAGNKDEEKLAACLMNVKGFAETYRGLIQYFNSERKLYDSAPSAKVYRWMEEDIKSIHDLESHQKELDEVIRSVLKQRA